MLTPTRFESPPTSIRRSRRLIRITQSIPGVSGLVTAYESAVTSFENRYNDWKLARDQASVALSAQHEAGAALAEEMRGVGLTTLKVGRGRRRSAVYHNYFPRGYGATLKLSAEAALQFAAGLLAAMSDETNPEILARREPLSAARAQLESAYTARRAADDVRGQAKAILEEEKFAWRNAHNDFYFGMRSFFPDRRRWVESLFRVNGRRQSDEEVPADGEKAGGEGDGEVQLVPTGLASPSTSTAITLVPSSTVTAPATPEPTGSASRTVEGGDAG